MTQITTESLAAWFAGRLPDDWFTAAPEVTADREEILVVGTLAEPAYPDGADDAARRRGAARPASSASARRRASERMRIADDAEHRTGRKVAWGARLRRRAPGVHAARGAGDDPAAHAGAPGARHARRRRRRAESLRRARMVRAAGARPRRRVDPAVAGRARRRRASRAPRAEPRPAKPSPHRPSPRAPPQEILRRGSSAPVARAK